MVLTAARAGRLMQSAGKDEIVRYVRSQLQSDGGFCGRAPASDLYYTVFGLACLAALSCPVPEALVLRYLEAIGEGSALDFVHLASGARCWAALSSPASAGRGRAFLHRMEAYRSRDGGYHHLEKEAAQGTVYGGFLAFLAYEETGEQLPGPDALLTSIRVLRTEDGGYANAAGLSLSSTTATSAALLLQHWIAGAVEEASVQALHACACTTGGFLAFAGAPGPDLLSTATALYALRLAGAPPASTAPHEAFVESLWADNGGFCGHPADPVTDCEYTFYALLALGACAGSGKER
jgi:hypothetical protein